MKLSEAIELFDDARRTEVADTTRQWYVYTDVNGRKSGRLWSLVEQLGDVDITTITIDHLRSWRNAIHDRNIRWETNPYRPTQEGGLSPDGYRNYIRAAKQFFKWLHDEGLLAHDPSQRIKIPPSSTDEPKAINIEDARAILNTANTFHLRDLAYYELLTQTNLKHGELDRLKLADVYDHTVTAYYRSRRDVYKPRYVDYGQAVARYINNWLEVRQTITESGEAELFFTGRLGGFRYTVRKGIVLGTRNNAIAQTLATSACRAGGLVSMRRSKLNLENGTAIVWEKGRNGVLKSRRIFLDAEAILSIEHWLRVHPKQTDTLFPGVHGPITRYGIYQIMINLATEAGVTEYTNPHAWRHAWAIEGLRNGADATTVARVLGNKPETVMRNYARWQTADVQQRHEQFSWKTKK